MIIIYNKDAVISTIWYIPNITVNITVEKGHCRVAEMFGNWKLSMLVQETSYIVMQPPSNSSLYRYYSSISVNLNGILYIILHRKCQVLWFSPTINQGVQGHRNYHTIYSISADSEMKYKMLIFTAFYIVFLLLHDMISHHNTPNNIGTSLPPVTTCNGRILF